MELTEDWRVEQNGGESLLLSAHRGDSEIYVYVNAIEKKDSRYSIKKIRKKRNEVFIPEGGTLVREDLLPVYDLFRDRIVRVFRFPDGYYMKQVVVVRNDAVFIVNMYNGTDDFFAEEPIVASIDVHHTLKSHFSLLGDNVGVFGLLALGLFAALGYGFDRLRRTNKWLAGSIVLVSLVAFAGMYVLLKQDMILAILVLLFYFIMWMSLQKNVFTNILNDVARRID
ncbi:MAG: hypothetical protein LBM20_00655 [Rikenellaceae bacterium]|nr:hypothetical protein [Rikenellaceae bacterium]